MGRSPQVQKARVLVIDDEPTVGRALRRALSRRHAVDVVCRADEGLKLLQTAPSYDVVLCDMVMPGMGGMGFYREVERLTPELCARVVLMSGGINVGPGVPTRGPTGIRVLGKPFDLAEVFALVDDVLAERHVVSRA